MKQKAKEWLKRYLPAEILSIIATLVCAWLANALTHNGVTTAFAGTLGGNVAYFGYILVSDIFISANKCKASSQQYGWKNFLLNIKALALEFGVAEVFDSLLIRPALMYYLPIWTGDLSLGIIMAKLLADVTFYIPAIISYELAKKHIAK